MLFLDHYATRQRMILQNIILVETSGIFFKILMAIIFLMLGVSSTDNQIDE